MPKCCRVLTFALYFLLSAFAPMVSADEPPLDSKWAEVVDPLKVNKLLARHLKLVQAKPSDFDLRIRTAYLAFYGWRLENKDNRQRLELAKLTFKMGNEAIKLRPERAEGYAFAGAGLGMIGLTRGVLNSLQLVPQGKAMLEKSRAIDADYADAMALTLLGRGYTMVPGFPMSIGDKSKALEVLLEAKKRAPNSTLQPLFLADLLWAIGRKDEALVELEKLAQAKPINELQYFLAETNRRKGKELEALIRSGVRRDPFFDVVSDIQPGLVD